MHDSDVIARIDGHARHRSEQPVIRQRLGQNGSTSNVGGDAWNADGAGAKTVSTATEEPRS